MHSAIILTPSRKPRMKFSMAVMLSISCCDSISFAKIVCPASSSCSASWVSKRATRFVARFNSELGAIPVRWGCCCRSRDLPKFFSPFSPPFQQRTIPQACGDSYRIWSELSVQTYLFHLRWWFFLCMRWCNPCPLIAAHKGADSAFPLREGYRPPALWDGHKPLHRGGHAGKRSGSLRAGRPRQFVAAMLLRIPGVADVVGLFFQPPAEVLPAPPGVIV